MRKEDIPDSNGDRVNKRIDEILECGFRYAKYKLCLKRNRIKADSNTLSYEYLLSRLIEEVEELKEQLKNPMILEKVALECGDVINFAAMIAEKTESIG